MYIVWKLKTLFDSQLIMILKQQKSQVKLCSKGSMDWIVPENNNFEKTETLKMLHVEENVDKNILSMKVSCRSK